MSLAPKCTDDKEPEFRVVSDPDRARNFWSATNCLTDSGMDKRDPHNYWVGRTRQKSHFVIDVGCSANIKEIHLRNSFNGPAKNR